MKALIKKDFYLLRGQLFSIAVAGVMFTLVLVITKSDIALIPCGFTGMSMSILVSLFTYDETGKFDNYSLGLPFGVKKIIFARYLVAFGNLIAFTLFGVMLTLLVAPNVDKQSLWNATYYVFILMSFVMAAFIPTIYKVCVSKLAIGIMVAIVVAVLYLIAIKFLGSMFAGTLYDQIERIGILAAAVIALVVSYNVSLHIIKDR